MNDNPNIDLKRSIIKTQNSGNALEVLLYSNTNTGYYFSIMNIYHSGDNISGAMNYTYETVFKKNSYCGSNIYKNKNDYIYESFGFSPNDKFYNRLFGAKDPNKFYDLVSKIKCYRG